MSPVPVPPGSLPPPQPGRRPAAWFVPLLVGAFVSVGILVLLVFLVSSRQTAIRRVPGTTSSAPSTQFPPVSLTAATPSLEALADPRADSLRLLTWAKSTVATLPSGDDRRDQALRRLTAAQARVGETKAAKATANTITDPVLRPAAWEDIAVALARAGDVVGAKAILQALPRRGVYYAAVHQIALAEARAGDWGAADATVNTFRVNEMTAELFLAVTLHGIALARFRAGQPAEAEVTANRIQDGFYRVATLRDIAVFQTRAGDADGARQTFARAGALANSLRQDHLRAEVLIDLAAAQANAGDAAGAEAVFGRALVSTNTLADASARPGYLAATAAARARTGNLLAARHAARSLTGPVLVKALCAIAIAQSRAGDGAGARWSLEDAKAVANDPASAHRRAQSLGEIAVAQVRAGDPTGAELTVADIGSVFHAAAALRAIVAADAVTDRLPTTETWMRSLSDPEERAYGYGLLAHAKVDPEGQASSDDDDGGMEPPAR